MHFEQDKMEKVIKSCDTYEQTLTIVEWFDRMWRTGLSQEQQRWFDSAVLKKQGELAVENK